MGVSMAIDKTPARSLEIDKAVKLFDGRAKASTSFAAVASAFLDATRGHDSKEERVGFVDGYRRIVVDDRGTDIGIASSMGVINACLDSLSDQYGTVPGDARQPAAAPLSKEEVTLWKVAMKAVDLKYDYEKKKGCVDLPMEEFYSSANIIIRMAKRTLP